MYSNNQEDTQTQTYPYDPYHELKFQFEIYDKECYEIFEYDNEQAGNNAIKHIKNLQNYIQKIIDYVTYIINSEQMFKELSVGEKQLLFQQYKQGYFEHYCDLTLDALNTQGNNNALDSEGQAARKAIDKQLELNDLIDNYTFNNHDSGFGRSRFGRARFGRARFGQRY